MPRYEKGDFIKVEFADEHTGVAEWMWVRVQSCDEEKQIVFGILDNEPLNTLGGRLGLGSELAISFERIRDRKKPWDFDPSD
jgi:hypothetical protein